MLLKCCLPAIVDQLDSSRLIWDRIATHPMKQLLQLGVLISNGENNKHTPFSDSSFFEFGCIPMRC